MPVPIGVARSTPSNAIRKALQLGATTVKIGGVKCYLSAIPAGTLTPTAAGADTVVKSVAADVNSKFSIAPTYFFPSGMPNAIDDVELVAIIWTGGITGMSDDTDKVVLSVIMSNLHAIGSTPTLDESSIYRSVYGFTATPQTYSGAGAANVYFEPHIEVLEDPDLTPFKRGVTPSYYNITPFPKIFKKDLAVFTNGNVITLILQPTLILAPTGVLADRVMSALNA